jgi:hypothetical protein
MVQVKQRKPRKIIQTAYGKVYEDVLERLENNFDTLVLTRAVDHVDFVIGRIEELREELLALHSMACVVINQGHATTRSQVEETIGELACWLCDQLSDCRRAMDQAYQAVKPLQDLLADPDDVVMQEQEAAAGG